MTSDSTACQRRQDKWRIQMLPAFTNGGWCLLLLMAAVLAGSARADEIELTNGKRYKGVLIDRDSRYVTFKAVIGGGTAQMTFPASRVRSVTVDGKMPPIKPPPPRKPKQPTSRPAAKITPTAEKPPGGTPKPPAPPAPARNTTRTTQEVESLIRRIGPTKPEWWDSVPLEYPKTLDLTWTKKGPKGFWPKKKLNNYLVALKHKPYLWKTAVKVMDHVMTVNKARPATVRKAMKATGDIYFLHLNDYARAAHWLRKGKGNYLFLINCYWQLGGKEMTAKALSQFGRDSTWEGQIIKLWGEMGELDKALALAAKKARSSRGDMAYVAAGHASRFAGQFKQALACYKKTLSARATKRNKGPRARARASIEAMEAIGNGVDLASIRDGQYSANSIGFRGPVHVEVVIKAGRIESVEVTRQKEDWHCSAIIEVPRQIVANQSIVGVDAITSATWTSEAIINATAKALGGAAKK